MLKVGENKVRENYRVRLLKDYFTDFQLNLVTVKSEVFVINYTQLCPDQLSSKKK